MNFDRIKNICPEFHELLVNPNVVEIIVDSGDDIYYSMPGKLENFELKLEDSVVEQLAIALIDMSGKSVNDNTGNIHFSLGELRVNVCTPRISQNGYIFNIMKLPAIEPTIDDLIKWNAITKEGSEILKKAIKEGKSILAAGGVGSGITTLCNILIKMINTNERVVTIEKVGTLQSNRKRIAKLVTANGLNEELPSLVDTASMMRGDYLVLNQIEGAEAFNFIELLRDGSSGIGVIKASNIFDSLKRLELKIAQADYSISAEEIKYMISEGFDYVVYQERLNDGSRKITGIAEIKFVDGRFDLDLVYRN